MKLLDLDKDMDGNQFSDSKSMTSNNSISSSDEQKDNSESVQRAATDPKIVSTAIL